MNDGETTDGFSWSFSSRVESEGDSVPSEEIDPTQIPVAGQTFGPFELRDELGRGGMGAVFRALDTRSQREVALKVVLGNRADPSRRKRFLREGQLTANLKHPGIVGVHSAGELDEALYLAYELVPNARTLTDAFADQGLRERVTLVEGAARALGFAHEQGVTHRDVKPDNVLVDAQGRARVADFGLAAAQGLERLTQTGAFVGTPLFMAPEQFDLRAPVGPRTDVWALGVILYLAATDELPFNGTSLMDLGAQILTCNPESPQALNPEVNAELAAVCGAALAADPEDRYATGTAMAADLARYLAGEPVEARRRSVTGVGRLWRRLSRRSRLLPPALVLLVAALAVAGAGVAWTSRRATQAQLALETGELELRVRKLELRSEQFMTRGGPVTRDLGRLEQLESEAQTLLRAGPHDPQRARIERSRARLAVLRGLHALGEDRVDDARRELDAARGHLSARDRGALSGSLLARSASTPSEGAEAMELLTLAIEHGLARPELRAWRGVATLASGANVRLLAEDALSALRELDTGGTLPKALRLARVHLALAAGQLSDAAEFLAELGDAPDSLAQAVTLARIAVRLEASDAISALDLATGSSFAPSPERARALDLASALADRWLTSGDPFDPDRVIAVLRLLRTLAPERPLSRQHIERVMGAIEIQRSNAPELALIVADELAPASWTAQRQAALFAGRVGSETAREMLHVVDRAVALAPTRADQVAMQLLQVAVLHEAGTAASRERCQALTTELLSSPDVDPSEHARLHVLRAITNPARQSAQALADMDRASALGYPMSPKDHLFRASALIALGRLEEARDAALPFARQGTGSAKHDQAVAHVWGLSRKLGNRDELVTCLDRLVSARPYYGGWRVRLAWALLADGRPEDAIAQLLRAAKTLSQHDAPSPGGRRARVGAHLQSLAPRVRRAAEFLRTGNPNAQKELDAVIEHLDALRGVDHWP